VGVKGIAVCIAETQGPVFVITHSLCSQRRRQPITLRFGSVETVEEGESYTRIGGGDIGGDLR